MQELEQNQPIIAAPSSSPKMKQEERMDLSPFFTYLGSPQGHEMASRVLQIIEGVKTITIEKTIAQAKFNRWMEAAVIVTVIIAVCMLSYSDKLNPTVGVVLGSVVGYFFGKSKS